MNTNNNTVWVKKGAGKFGSKSLVIQVSVLVSNQSVIDAARSILGVTVSINNSGPGNSQPLVILGLVWAIRSQAWEHGSMQASKRKHLWVPYMCNKLGVQIFAGWP